jgi:hypothetical protein
VLGFARLRVRRGRGRERDRNRDRGRLEERRDGHALVALSSASGASRLIARPRRDELHIASVTPLTRGFRARSVMPRNDCEVGASVPGRSMKALSLLQICWRSVSRCPRTRMRAIARSACTTAWSACRPARHSWPT